MNRPTWLFHTFLPAALLFSILSRASAVDKHACVFAYEEAQRLRMAGELLEAREQLRACSHADCPHLIAKDCVMWLREVDNALPSVVLGARTPDGVDVTDARVWLDGRLLENALSGSAIEVDPGPHVFRYEHPGSRPIEEHVIVNQGEKNRQLRVILSPSPSLRPIPAVGSTTSARPPTFGNAPSRRSHAGLLGASIASGVVGAAALAAGIALDVRARSHLDDLRSSCAPNCSPSAVDAAHRKMVVGDSLLAVGVVSIAVAIGLFLRHQRVSSGSSPESAERMSRSAMRR